MMLEYKDVGGYDINFNDLIEFNRSKNIDDLDELILKYLLEKGLRKDLLECATRESHVIMSVEEVRKIKLERINAKIENRDCS